jgi:hypothetical protein
MSAVLHALATCPSYPLPRNQRPSRPHGTADRWLDVTCAYCLSSISARQVMHAIEMQSELDELDEIFLTVDRTDEQPERTLEHG